MTQFDPTNRLAEAAEREAQRESAEGAMDAKGPEAADRLLEDLAALGDQAALYLAARQDQLKLGVRRVVLGVVLGILALFVVAAVLVAAAVMTLAGIALGLAELFGERLWLGELATGTVILALGALASYLSVQKILRNSRWKTINRYAELHKRQQTGRRPIAPKSTAGPVGE